MMMMRTLQAKPVEKEMARLEGKLKSAASEACSMFFVTITIFIFFTITITIIIIIIIIITCWQSLA